MKMNIIDEINLLDPTDLLEGQVFKNIEDNIYEQFYAFVDYFNDNGEIDFYDPESHKPIVNAWNFARLILFTDGGLSVQDVDLINFSKWKIKPLQILEISVKG